MVVVTAIIMSVLLQMRNPIMSQHCMLQFIATFHNDKVIFDFSFTHIVFSLILFTWYITLTITTFFGQNYIKIPAFYHEQWAPHYPDFVRFDYDGASYQIRLRQHWGKLFFAYVLKHLRKHLDIYESVTINFMACEHRWIFNLHFTPPLEQQACGRPLLATRMHVWTLELTQVLLGDPKPLVIYNYYFYIIIKFLPEKINSVKFFVQMLPPLAAMHLPSCVFIWRF